MQHQPWWAKDCTLCLYPLPWGLAKRPAWPGRSAHCAGHRQRQTAVVVIATKITAVQGKAGAGRANAEQHLGATASRRAPHDSDVTLTGAAKTGTTAWERREGQRPPPLQYTPRLRSTPAYCAAPASFGSSPKPLLPCQGEKMRGHVTSHLLSRLVTHHDIASGASALKILPLEDLPPLVG